MAILNLTRSLWTEKEPNEVPQSETLTATEQATDAVSRLLRMLDSDVSTVHDPLSAETVGDHVPTASDGDTSGLAPGISEPESAAIVLDTPEESVVPATPVSAPTETHTRATEESAHERHRADLKNRLTSALDAARTEADARRALEQELARVTADSERRLERINGELATALENAHAETALRTAAETSLARLVEAGVRHMAEQELARVRKEGEARLNRLQHELAAAVDTARIEATRLRVVEAELAHIKDESSQRLAVMEERLEALVKQPRAVPAPNPRKSAPGKKKVTRAPAASTRAKPTKKVVTAKRKKAAATSS